MADDLDILSLTEAKAALNIPATNTDYDTELAQVVTAASRFVDSVAGAVVERTITAEEHQGRSTSISLDHYPVVSITTVTEYQAGAATVLTAETLLTAGTYAIDLTSGTVYRRNSWNPSHFASSGVAVTYVAGRYADTASVDPVYKEAAAFTVKHLWEKRGSGNGVGVLGGDGERFGGATTYSTPELRRQVSALLADPVPGIA